MHSDYHSTGKIIPSSSLTSYYCTSESSLTQITQGKVNDIRSFDFKYKLLCRDLKDTLIYFEMAYNALVLF